ncbi:globin [Caldalkalibacillus salinus]|uniref:globin domain-containing protein n=1 Tax=Caldalkalibacillus salinus TaxID=2803787 RepID=UPI0019230F13|nr:globin [Caldalkalibacillus salinus]
MDEHKQTLYERFGGHTVLEKIVDDFYNRVAQHSDLSPIFPDDLTETKEKQLAFLTQYFGGEPLYVQKYQRHPMLRARHMPFPITPTRAKAWLGCMTAAIEGAGIEEDIKHEMLSRLTFTAQHMINTPDENPDTDRPSEE